MWPYSRIISHRGGGILAPENTLAAMSIAKLYNVLAVEFDVMLTKDKVAIVMHDDALGRTIAGEGSIADKLSSEIFSLDAGIWWDKKAHEISSKPESELSDELISLLKSLQSLPKIYRGEIVPTYEQVALFCKNNNIWMNVEIKPVPGYEVETAEAVARITSSIYHQELSVDNCNPCTIPLFSSFSFDALMAAKLAAPNIPRGYLLDVIPSDWKEKLDQLDTKYLHTNGKNLTLQMAKEIKSAGYCIFCYTINKEEDVQQLMGIGVDAICTDRIDSLKDLFL